jgi:hypothetical protein
MEFTSSKGKWIQPAFFLLVFYTFGASMMDSFVVYHTWRFTGEAEFAMMHQASGKRIVAVFVIPTLIMTVFLILLFWHRHRSVSRRLIWLALIFTIIPWLSSAFIQIPMQIELDKGRNDQLLNKLITSDWIRVIPSFGLAIVAFCMLRKTMSATQSG